MNTPHSIQLSTLDTFGNLLMTWPHQPDKEQIVKAFSSIRTFLEISHRRMYIVVDLSTNPQFNMSVTIQNAMKVHTHAHFGGWLVVGANARAHLIGQALTTMTQSQTIFWFDTVSEATVFLRQHLPIEE